MGKVVLVTGSTRGIGLATAIALARSDFSVAVNGPSDDAELATALLRVQQTGAPAVAVPWDVTDIAACEPGLARIEAELGPLTCLVNNAGIGVRARTDPLHTSQASWDRCLAVNARAMFFIIQTFARRLLARERPKDVPHSIVNVTSSNATAITLPRAEYCVSKAAAAMVSQIWAARLGPEGVAVYDVRPGIIETAMTHPVMDDYRRRINEDGLVPLSRVGQPQDVAQVIAALATGKLPYTTGQVISPDGGLLIPRF